MRPFKPLFALVSGIAVFPFAAGTASAEEACAIVADFLLGQAGAASDGASVAGQETMPIPDDDRARQSQPGVSQQEMPIGCEQIDPSWTTTSPPRSVRINERRYTMFFCDDPSSSQTGGGERQKRERVPVEPIVSADIAKRDDGSESSEGDDDARQPADKARRDRDRRRSSSRKKRMPIEPTVSADVKPLQCVYDRSCGGYRLARGDDPLLGVSIKIDGAGMSYEEGCIR